MNLGFRWLILLAAAFAILLKADLASAQDAKNHYHFIITTSGGAFPIISGPTDVPNGMQLFVVLIMAALPDGQQRLAQGLPVCGEPCLPATGPDNRTVGAKATVKNGRFTAGPFSNGGAPFKPAPATYPLWITIWPDDKTGTPEQIRAAGTPVYISTIQISKNTEARTAVDLDSIRYDNTGRAIAVICGVDLDNCAPGNTAHWFSDCHGHITDLDNRRALSESSEQVAGAIASVVCGIKNPKLQ
jgi:hypothetical protein